MLPKGFQQQNKRISHIKPILASSHYFTLDIQCITLSVPSVPKGAVVASELQSRDFWLSRLKTKADDAFAVDAFSTVEQSSTKS